MSVRLRPSVVAAVAVGGAIGTCARAEVERVVGGGPPGWPWGTFVVNITGSFVLGVLVALALDRLPPTRFVLPLLATGVCGAYTTFSTLVVEVDLLLRAGRVALAATYLAGSLAAGLVALSGGLAAGRALPLRTRQ